MEKEKRLGGGIVLEKSNTWGEE